MAPTFTERLTDLLEPQAVSAGLELVAVEVAGHAGSQVVRVYLDRQGGIDLDALAGANAWIAEALETQPELQGSYTLEVSSPGIERPIVKHADWGRFTGHTVAVKTAERIEGHRSFTGINEGRDGDVIVLRSGSDTYRIPLGLISRAHLKVDMAALGEGKTR